MQRAVGIPERENGVVVVPIGLANGVVGRTVAPINIAKNVWVDKAVVQRAVKNG